MTQRPRKRRRLTQKTLKVEIDSAVRSHLKNLWGGTALLGIASIFLLIILPAALEKSGPVAWLVLSEPLITLVLLTIAIRDTWRWLKTGTAALTLDPFPGAIGGQVGGQIRLKLPVSADADAFCTLSCVDKYWYRHHGKAHRGETDVWSEQGPLVVTASGKGSLLRFALDVPGGLPQSGEKTRHGIKGAHVWRLEVRIPELEFEQEFEIPVHPSTARSGHAELNAQTPARSDFQASGHDRQAAERLLHRHGVRVKQVAGWTEMVFRVEGYRVVGGVLAGFGGLFLLAGIFLMLIGHADWMGVIASAGVGGYLLVWGLGLYGRTLSLRCNKEQLVVVERQFPKSAKRRSLAKSGIQELRVKKGQMDDYQILAVSSGNQSTLIAEGLRGQSAALALREQIRETLRLR